MGQCGTHIIPCQVCLLSSARCCSRLSVAYHLFVKHFIFFPEIPSRVGDGPSARWGQIFPLRSLVRPLIFNLGQVLQVIRNTTKPGKNAGLPKGTTISLNSSSVVTLSSIGLSMEEGVIRYLVPRISRGSINALNTLRVFMGL